MSRDDVVKKLDHHLEFSSYHEISDEAERTHLVAGAEIFQDDEEWGDDAGPTAKRIKRSDGGGASSVTSSNARGDAIDGAAKDPGPTMFSWPKNNPFRPGLSGLGSRARSVRLLHTAIWIA